MKTDVGAKRYRIENDKLVFNSWWMDGDQNDVEEPWETFHLAAFGQEAGDWLEDWDKLSAALARAGLGIVDLGAGELI